MNYRHILEFQIELSKEKGKLSSKLKMQNLARPVRRLIRRGIKSMLIKSKPEIGFLSSNLTITTFNGYIYRVKKPLLTVSAFYLSTVIVITFSGCSSSAIPTPYLAENRYQPSSLKIVEEYSNLEFKAANNDKYVYLSIVIKTDSNDRRYSNSIINLWLSSNGLHSKNSGFQFPLKKHVHPFLKNQFSSITNWGGFKSMLTDTQKVRLHNLIRDAETKILYFNKENGSIDPIESDGSRGFRLNKAIKKNEIILNFVIPLNADTDDQLGVIGEVKNNLAIGFEIMPNYSIFRSNTRPQQPLNSPGLGRPLQQSGRSFSDPQSRTGQKSEIYWLDLILSKGNSLY